MNISEHLQNNARLIDQEMRNLLGAAPCASDHLREALIYGTIGSGKKLRPWLVMECARLVNAKTQNALQCALAVECVHAYSLIHDDLPAMDNDDLRRGKPTTHIAFDEATAILAGDSLLTLAFDILANEKTHSDAQIRVQLISELAKAAGAGGMVGGQMLDLNASDNGFDMAQTIEMQKLKTGALIVFSCTAPAILSACQPDMTKRLSDYGQAIGLAFQITDDLLDASGAEEKTGKRTGKDKESGKATFIDFLGKDGAQQEAEKLVMAAKKALAPFGDAADNLTEIADYILTREG